jgi:hypothetical protein
MTFSGQVVDGQIVLPAPLSLPNGTTVKVEVVPAEPPAPPAGDRPKSFLEHFKDVIGKVDLPPDAAEQHDHYLYGTPKR